MQRTRRHFPAWAILSLLLVPAATGTPGRLRPDAVQPGPSIPAAESAPGGGLRLTAPFDRPDLDRAYWDMPIRPPGPASPGLAVELDCPDPAALRAVTLHLHSRGHWLSAQQTLPAPGRQTLIFDAVDFIPESGSPDWRLADRARLSVWKGEPRPVSLILHAIRPHSPAFLILQGSERSAPGETALAAQCAARARRLLEKAGIPAAVTGDDLDPLDPRSCRWVILPYNPSLTSRQLDILKRFVRRKGRVGVFYHSGASLAQTLGFEILPYATQSENWTEAAFDSAAAKGLPPSLPHVTRHLLPVRASGRTAGTLGHWVTPDGFPDRSLPAAAVSPQGFWFSHIPPLASPSSVQWLLASLAAADPSCQPALDAWQTNHRQREQQAAALLADSIPPPGEIRAVWARLLPPRRRDSILRALAEHGIPTVMEHLVSLGDNLPSDAALLRRITRVVDSSRNQGISLHPWVVVWNLDGLPPERIAAFAAQNRLMLDANGNPLPWLCPLHDDNVRLLHSTLALLADAKPPGIHLDYVRYPARTGCYCPRHRAAFESRSQRPVNRWPADILPGGPRAAEWNRFRQDHLTDLLEDASRRLRDAHPGLRLSAAVYPTPESAAENGQDWPEWLRRNAFDFLSPMLYVDDASLFAQRLSRAVAAAPSPQRLLPGIGTGADESQLDALSAARQILACRDQQTAGFALFQLDSDLLSRILPAFPPPPADH